MKRVVVLAVAAFALMSVWVVSGAAGHKSKVDTAVTAKLDKADPNDPYGTDAFEGSVNSSAKCEKKRTVTLFQRAADGSAGSAVDTDVTDANGAWEISSSSFFPGTYYAKVSKRVLRKNTKHSHICKKATSKDVKVK